MNKTSRYNEKLLLFGRWTSKVGDIVFDYVNSVVLVHAFTNSSWVLAIYQSSQTIMGVLFNLIGGAFADAGRRKKILIITDFLSALVCLIASFFIDSKFVAQSLILANAILAFVFAFSSPAFKAIVREMLTADRISKYNSVSNAGRELISMAGPAIGVALMNVLGARGALVVNAVTFLISAISECLLVEIDTDASKNIIQKKMNLIHDIKEGLIYLWHEKTIFYLLVLSAFVNFFLAGYNLILPYTDILYADIFQGFYAKAMVAEAIGALLGSIVNSKMSTKATNDFKKFVIFLGMTGFSLLFVPLGVIIHNVFAGLIPIMLFGLFLTIFNINYMSFVQVNVDEEYLGRVFSVIFTIAALFMPLGACFFSIIKLINCLMGFCFLGLGIIVLTIMALLCSDGSLTVE